MLHIGNLFPGEGKGWSEDLPTEEGARKGQHSASQCRPKLQPNYRRNFSKDSNLYGQMDRVNRRSRDFRYCIRLSTGFFGDPSSAKTSNSIQPFRRGGEVGDLEVEKLLRNGAIEEVEPCENQFLSNIFTIPKKGGERRLVVDMRDLNNFIEPVHFKMEDLSHLPSVLWRGDFMCKIDLKDVYQTIPIAKKIKDLPKVSLERETLPVHMSTFRPQILSKNFHKGSETPLGLPQSSGSSTAGVFR